MMHRTLLLLTLGAAACGEAEEQVASFVIPWQLPLVQCPERATLGNQLAVDMVVGGYLEERDRCNLVVNGDLTARGSCGPYKRGTVRPVLVTYRQKASNGSAAKLPLAYLVSFVNLCENVLSAGEDRVTLTLSPGVTARFLYKQSELLALPTGPAPKASCSNGLAEAEQWARSVAIPSTESLDSNCQGAPNCSNLEEACAGTLFTP